VESLVLNDVVEFNAEKRVRKALIKAPNVICELVCYEPGQGVVTHQHPRQDEIFYVVEGKGEMWIEEERIAVGPGSLVLAPSQKRHGLTAGADSRMVVLFFKGPGTSLS